MKNLTNETILETLKVQPLTEEEKQSRHILKRLTGPIASCKEGTRNGRKYNRSLWEQALNDEIFQEKVANKGLFLELGHPDREEIDMSCACACIPEVPKIIDDDLYAVVDVLDTPTGRILNTLIDYGFRPGISSRGTGDVVGDEVDPDTFMLETWDIVNVPALEKARLSVTEGLDTNAVNLRKALTESIEKADDKDKEIMAESLKQLGINLNNSETDAKLNESNPTDVGDDTKLEESKTSEQTEDKHDEANNDGSESIIKSLQEALKSNAELEAKVQSLQNELAVRDTKVGKLEEEISRNKSTIVRLTNIAKDSREKTERISTLEKELNESKQTIETLNKRPIKEGLEDKNKSLRESLSKKNREITSLTEQLNNLKKESETTINSLKESLDKEKEAHTNEVNSLKESLDKSNKLVEKYTKIADNVANRYIKSKAKALGVEVEEVMNKLPDNYTLNDVDRVCENLMRYKVNMSKLPFELDSKSVVKVTESKHVGIHTDVNNEDYVDDSLYELAGVKKN